MGARDKNLAGPSPCGCKVKEKYFDDANLVNEGNSKRGCQCLDIARSPSQEGTCPVHGAVALALGHGVVHRFNRKIGDR